MCDLVVSKTGYSTASEAIRAKIPVFFIKRDGFKEDELIGDTIERMGIGRFISQRSFLSGEWWDEIGDLDKYILNFDNMDDRFRSDGAEEIIGEIRKYYKEWYLLYRSNCRIIYQKLNYESIQK